MKKDKQRIVDERLSFTLHEDHITAGKGEFYFLRLYPRNMDILSFYERDREYRKLQVLLDSDGSEIAFLSLDKTEGLEEVRGYYENLIQQYPLHKAVNGEILRQLDGLANHSCVERAHYMILRVKERSGFERFRQLAEGYLRFRVADRAELLILLKNFLLREYSALRLADWDEDIRLKFETEQAAYEEQKRRRRGNSPPEYVELAQRETQRLLLPNRLRFDTRYTEQSGNLYRQTLAVRGYPAELVTDGVLRQLGSMAGVTLKLYLSPIGMAETSAMLARQVNQRMSAARSARKESERVKSVWEQEQVADVYRRQMERTARMYFVSILAEVYGTCPAELAEQAERVRTALMTQGFLVDDLRWEQREAFFSMLPWGQNRVDIFRRNMPTRTISTLYPFTASRKVDPHGLFLGYTSAGSPLFWDVARRTEQITNGIALVAGAPGQGKSYLMKKILCQFIARGFAVYGLDAEAEYVSLYSYMGGSNLHCAGGAVKINPLEIRWLADVALETEYAAETDTADDPAAFREGSALLQHLGWLKAFHRLLFPGLSEMQQNLLMILTQQHYAQLDIDAAFDPEGQDASRYPTYTSLYRYIEGIFDSGGKEKEDHKLFQREDLRAILLALHGVYTGAESAIFNGQTNVKNSRVINFVVQALMDGDGTVRDAALFNVLSYIWHQVVTRRETSAFFLDEMYLYLNPVVVEWLRNFCKRSRKYNAHIFMATQNLADFEDSAIRHMTKPLFELALHKFLFYPGDVDREAMRQLLSLTDSEMEVITASRQRHCLYICANEKYSLEVGTLEGEKQWFGE